MAVAPGGTVAGGLRERENFPRQPTKLIATTTGLLGQKGAGSVRRMEAVIGGGGLSRFEDSPRLLFAVVLLRNDLILFILFDFLAGGGGSGG